jgi:hypothetical protein
MTDALKYIYSKDAIEQLFWRFEKKDLLTYKDNYINQLSLINNPLYNYHMVNKKPKRTLITGVWAKPNPFFRFREGMYFKFIQKFQLKATSFVLRKLRNMHKRKKFKEA